MSDIQLNEAPASATLSVITPKGFNTLLTVRDTSASGLIEKIEKLEKMIDELGYKPQVRQSFGQKKEVELVKNADGTDMLCPTCHKGNIKIIKSAKGTFYGCTNSKFNPTTKGYDGCKYFSTVDPSLQKVADDLDIPDDF